MSSKSGGNVIWLLLWEPVRRFIAGRDESSQAGHAVAIGGSEQGLGRAWRCIMISTCDASGTASAEGTGRQRTGKTRCAPAWQAIECAFMLVANSVEPGDGLSWSMQAIQDAMDRPNKIAATDLPRAFAAIGETLWWIIILDGTLRDRYRLQYDRAISLTSPNPTDYLNGLRSVRNRIGHEAPLVDFLDPLAAREWSADGRVTARAWKAIEPPARRLRSAKDHERDLQLHAAYSTSLVGQNIWQSFMVSSGFFGQVLRVISGELGMK
jgi:hypothetical protein